MFEFDDNMMGIYWLIVIYKELIFLDLKILRILVCDVIEKLESYVEYDFLVYNKR